MVGACVVGACVVGARVVGARVVGGGAVVGGLLVGAAVGGGGSFKHVPASNHPCLSLTNADVVLVMYWTF
jgi:hypothetical protein